MPPSADREKVHFTSGDTRCAAWHHPGRNGARVVMAAGLAVTKEPGTDPFAERFNAAGFTVLAFDSRRLGHVFTVAARDPRLAAAIAHSPFADGRAATSNAKAASGRLVA